MNNLKLIFFKKRYFASAQLFLSLALLFGTWVIYIPTITSKIGLSKGNLGIVLLFGAIGSIFSLPFGKAVVSKIGEGRLAFISILLLSVSMLGNFVSVSFAQLCVSLFFNGFFSGFLQIGINSIVSTLEKEDDVSIMSASHGFFSLGGIIASGFGTMLLILIGNPLLHIIMIVLLVVVLQLVFSGNYIHLRRESNKRYVAGSFLKSTINSTTLWALAIIALCVMVSEGAIADWSGLFLRDVVLTSPNIVGLGYAGFSVAMTFGRFMGDYFSKRYGAWKVILTGFIFSIFGFLLVLTVTTFTSLLGFLMIGLGFSSIVPEVYRLSTNVEGVEASSGIAFMAGAGYFGFLAGPVVLGAVAENLGLKVSFYLLLVTVLTGTIVSYFVYIQKSSIK